MTSGRDGGIAPSRFVWGILPGSGGFPSARRQSAGRSRFALLSAILAIAGSFLWHPDGWAAELLMFEQKACPFCEQFNREIAPDYPRSRAGSLAPLRHVDIWESRTGGIAGLEPAVFTPTFVLVEGNREIGRLLGYPGRRYFYPEIQRLIDGLGGKPSTTGASPASAASGSNLD